MSNKNLRDYIRLVEEVTGTEPAGIDWIKSKLPNINLPDIKQMVPGLAEPVKPSDPSLQAHQARVAAQKPAEPADAQAAKERVMPKKAAPTAKRTAKIPHKSTTKTKPKAEPTVIKSTKPSAKPAPKASDSAKKPQPSSKKPEPQVAKKASDPGVMQTQQFLKNLGYDIKLDGIWGPQTEQAYRSAFPNAPSNQREPTGIIRPNSSQQPVPDKYTQGKLDKAGQSADIAAAAGMPNPFIKPSVNESDLLRIKDLVNYKK